MTDTPLIPRRILFGEAARVAPSLSPSGTHLAFLVPHDNGLHVWMGHLDHRDFRALTDPHGRPVEDYAWARDGGHILYLTDRDGDENHHLIAVDLADGACRDLTPFEGAQVRIVGLQRRVPDQVLIELNLGSRELCRLRLTDGAREAVSTEPGLTGWLTDPGLRVRAAQRANADGGFTILVRDDEDCAFRPLLTIGYEDATGSQLLGFTGDGKDLLLLSPLDAETTRLLRLSTTTGAIDVLHEDPAYDVTNASLHPVTGQADLAVVERERTELIALDRQTARDLDRVRELCRGDVIPLNRDLANRRWLLQENVDDGPAAYHLYEPAAGTLERLFTHQPALSGYRLSTMEPFRFVARDGLTIHGYLTFPRDRRHRLPSVLNVHGGPWERNRWGFRAESQWLADRGYLCIEVNYRGSSGYGRRFTLAGDREWGGRMQDDLLDAVRWAVDRGYADPDRVAVMGTSYGGYAALVGASFTPDVFRCAVAAAAPVNLVTFVESVPDFWQPIRAKLRRCIGDPVADRDLLWSRSPLSRVGDIRIPVLVAYGRNDPRVPVSEAEQMVTALRAHGVEHRYLLFADEGHGLRKPANALAYRAAVEEFLARHLGGRCE